jgi:hypothetical protein
MGMPDVGLAKGQRPAPVTAAPFFRDEVLPIRTSRWNRPKLLLRCSTISPLTPSSDLSRIPFAQAVCLAIVFAWVLF